MKKRAATSLTRSWGVATILVAASVLSVAAQTFKAAGGTSGTTSPPTPLSHSQGRFDHAAGKKSADQYKLIFPVGREGGIPGKDEISERGRVSLIDSFVGQLNKVGARGYRLISATSRYPMALVELGDTQYEYAWFDAVDGAGLDGKYEALARHGFRLVAELFWSESQFWCESCYTGSVTDKTVTETRLYYLCEREKGVEKPTQSAILNIGWGGTASGELKSRINEKLVEGFYPTGVLNFSKLLLEKTEGDDKPSLIIPEVQVVISLSGWYDDRKVREKVNALAQQGYRLDLSRDRVAVMHRSGGEVTPVKYVWVDAKHKDFEARLAKLQEGGAIYRMTHPNRFLQETRLVFEQGAGDASRRHEYKVLKFDLETAQALTGKRVNIDLTRASKDSLIALDSLVQQGFRVRDLFDSDKVAALLER